MEFASRGARLLALAAAGLAIGATACRGRKPPRPPPVPTFTLAGAVRDQGGRGVPGTRVLVLAPRDAGGAQTGARQTRSAGEGAFRVEGLPRGRYTVIVEALGLGVVEPAPADVPGPAVDIRLPAGVRWLDGEVVDDRGQPVPNARVLL